MLKIRFVSLLFLLAFLCACEDESIVSFESDPVYLKIVEQREFYRELKDKTKDNLQRSLKEFKTTEPDTKLFFYYRQEIKNSRKILRGAKRDFLYHKIKADRRRYEFQYLVSRNKINHEVSKTMASHYEIYTRLRKASPDWTFRVPKLKSTENAIAAALESK